VQDIIFVKVKFDKSMLLMRQMENHDKENENVILSSRTLFPFNNITINQTERSERNLKRLRETRQKGNDMR
jgi:hypothetical protein